MSVSLVPVITMAGLQAVLSASNDGLQARIAHIALGDNGWAPTAATTALHHERNRVPVSNGTRITPTQIHLTAVENGDAEYWVREVGFVLDDGTLLAVWSHPTQALAWKAADVDLLLAFDMVLSALPADSVTIVGTGGVNLAPATTAHEGVVRLATMAEAQAGVIATAVAMTPAGSRAHGDARYSALGHRHGWVDIDGKPATFPPNGHRHPWAELDGVPASFPPIVHRHSWSEIDARPATYPPALHRHNWTEIDSKPVTYPPSLHDHDGRYLQPGNLVMTNGFVRTFNRYSAAGWAGYNDWTRNYADIFPPAGFTMSNLMGFTASPGLIYFGGDVNSDDSLWCRWEWRSDRVRVICANSENRGDTSGIGSYVNYLAIWRK